MRILLAVLFATFLVPGAGAKEAVIVTNNKNRDDVIAVSLHRLEQASPSKAAELKGALAEFKTQGDNATLMKAAQLLEDIAKTGSVRSKVKIETKPTAGAKVKYQTLGQRQRDEAPTTAAGSTSLVERMNVGVYFVWSERNGDATTSKDEQYYIVDPEISITLVEQ